MWELNYEESWVLKNWCFWTVVLEKTLESPLDCKEIQPVHSEGDQSCVFIGRTDAEAETPILWPPHGKNWLIGKDPDAGRDWGQEEKDDRGWDGWMASPTWWTWVWVNSGSWWWRGRPGMLWFTGLQTVGHYWATELNCGQESLRRNVVDIIVNKTVWNAVLGCSLKNDRKIYVHLQGKPFNSTVIQGYAPSGNGEEAKVGRFYEELKDLLEPTTKKYVLFIIGDWNEKLGSQETPGVIGKFGLRVKNEAG